MNTEMLILNKDEMKNKESKHYMTYDSIIVFLSNNLFVDIFVY